MVRIGLRVEVRGLGVRVGVRIVVGVRVRG